MPKKQLVAEALIDLHRRLSTLPARSHERRIIMQETANLYGVSEQTLYRALAQGARPRGFGKSKDAPDAESTSLATIPARQKASN